MASYKSVGFGDDRRSQADAHKPRGRNDRSERDRILAYRAPSDGREGENNRDFRDDRNSRDTTKEMGQNRSALKLNTEIPTAPRAQMSPHKDSPSGGRPSTAKPSLGTDSSKTATPTRPFPKSSDPSLQGTFEVLYKSYEILSKRTLLGWQREKKKKEMETRRTEASNTAPNSHSLREAQKIQKTRDEEDWKVLSERYSTIDKDHRGTLEAIAAIIQRAQPPASGLPAAPPTTDPAMADLAAKLADLEKKHRQAQDEIQKLQTARPRWSDLEGKLSQAQEAIVQLQTSREKSTDEQEKATEVCRVLTYKQNQLEKDKAALAEENAQLKERVATLQEDFDEMRSAMSSKASKVELMEAKASAQNSTTGSSNAQQGTEALSSMMEELKTRLAAAEVGLQTVDCKATNVDSKFASVGTELSSIRFSVSKFEGCVTTIESTVSRVDSELAAVQGTVSRVDTSLATVRDRISTVENELSTIRERTDNLDFQTLDEIADTWMTHNIGESVPIMKQKLEEFNKDIAQIPNQHQKLKQKLEEFDKDVAQIPNQHQKLLQQTRQEIEKLSKTMTEPGSRLVQEPTPPVPDEDLKKQIIDLQQKSQMIAQLQVAVATTGQQIRGIHENFQKLHKYTEDSIDKQAGLFGEMLDDVSRRVTELEGARSGFVTRMDDLTPRVTELEGACSGFVTRMDNLAPRVTKLEIMANDASFREDVKTKLITVEQKLAALPDTDVQASVQRDVQLLTQKIKAMEVHLDEGGKRLEAVTLGIETLNDQLSHITTRNLFDLIVRHVDQNHHRYGARISSLETKSAITQNAVDRANETLQRLQDAHTTQRLQGAHATQRLDTKRSASPAAQTGENSIKRMRVARNVM